MRRAQRTASTGGYRLRFCVRDDTGRDCLNLSAQAETGTAPEQIKGLGEHLPITARCRFYELSLKSCTSMEYRPNRYLSEVHVWRIEAALALHLFDHDNIFEAITGTCNKRAIPVLGSQEETRREQGVTCVASTSRRIILISRGEVLMQAVMSHSTQWLQNNADH
ncbi:hypothetical protein OE88DRAFT_460124 [Heliocybe sulcata]|uniref:Uncharacterized protein n=1 Tax=Heliocybe sulcata TaxID=5364 RepID=A0A5C3MVL1_9AGAM|nr:hypothetical protein OE88DRAFT_460124 [Heliocybe sulcata]